MGCGTGLVGIVEVNERVWAEEAESTEATCATAHNLANMKH